MREQVNNPSANVPPAPTGAALVWLRDRLRPRGDNVLMLAVYIGILLSMVTTALAHARIAPPAFYGTMLALSAMLVLQVLLQDTEQRFGEPTAHAIHLLSNGTLFLLASWLSLSDNSFLPYLLFILTGQSIVMLHSWRSGVYSLALFAGWLVVIWLKGASPANITDNAVAIGLGMFFTALFCVVILGYNRQKEHAESLLSQLQAANSELAAAREREKELAVAEERVRLARDIHDGLGHHLAVLNVQLQAAERLVERDPARAASAIGVSREVAQAAMQEVRQSVAAMRQTPLDGRSLDAALRELVRDFNKRASLSAQLHIHGDAANLAAPVAMTLYRAAQEGLTNAQKHAKAAHVRVELASDASSVSLEVRDDGAGTPVGVGFGLAGLRERAEQLGGCFVAGPHPEGGFHLRIELPQ